MTLACSQINDSTGLCATLEGTGYGLGVLFQALGQSLPALILILGVIGGVVLIIGSVAFVIRKAIGGNIKVK